MWYKGLRELTTTGKTDADRVKAAPFYFREASRRLERFVGDYPLFVLLLEISNACNTMDASEQDLCATETGFIPESALRSESPGP
ncbi:MAG: hypothetical protein GF334_02330 [Candidatus Altiarchaeales archaeon]|nr:hypothetical protein [Candidatus Altiarchaeales archaeon]